MQPDNQTTNSAGNRVQVTLIFRCLATDDPAYHAPEMRKTPDTVIESR